MVAKTFLVFQVALLLNLKPLNFSIAGRHIHYAWAMVAVASILVLPTTSRQQLPHWEEALPKEARSVASG